jgi:hypothetical protein
MERPSDPRCPARSNRYVEQKFEQPVSTILACEVQHLRRAEAAGIGGSYVGSTAEPLGVTGGIMRSEAAAEAGALLEWRKPKWLDVLSVAVGKVHFTAHVVAMVIGYQMTSGTSGD